MFSNELFDCFLFTCVDKHSKFKSTFSFTDLGQTPSVLNTLNSLGMRTIYSRVLKVTELDFISRRKIYFNVKSLRILAMRILELREKREYDRGQKIPKGGL